MGLNAAFLKKDKRDVLPSRCMPSIDRELRQNFCNSFEFLAPVIESNKYVAPCLKNSKIFRKLEKVSYFFNFDREKRQVFTMLEK